MHQQFKIYWKLYEECFSNEELLENFCNLMDVYHSSGKADIIDIGCGQSQYLIDFYKNTNYNLYAIDNEPIQIDALKRRIEKIKSNSSIKFSINEFPTKEFSEIKFTGVIVSNLLHFMDLKESYDFIKKIEKQTSKGSLILFKTHSWRHNSNGDFSYFKHYFRKKDFYKLLPKNKYEYLYFEQKSATKNEREIWFVKKWIEAWLNFNNVFDKDKISKAQENHLKNIENTENMTVVVKRK